MSNALTQQNQSVAKSEVVNGHQLDQDGRSVSIRAGVGPSKHHRVHRKGPVVVDAQRIRADGYATDEQANGEGFCDVQPRLVACPA